MCERERKDILVILGSAEVCRQTGFVLFHSLTIAPILNSLERERERERECTCMYLHECKGERK